MGIVDDDGVYIGNINPAFNNIGTNKYVVLFINKIKNTLFQNVRLQLAVGKTNAQVGAKGLYQPGHFGQSLHPVMNKKYLPAALCFKINGIANEVLVKYHHFSLYGLPV